MTNFALHLNVCLNREEFGKDMVKTITIREEVYKKLKALKREGESFSDLLESLAENADPHETLRELRGSMEFQRKGEILSEIDEKRKERRI